MINLLNSGKQFFIDQLQNLGEIFQKFPTKHKKNILEYIYRKAFTYLFLRTRFWPKFKEPLDNLEKKVFLDFVQCAYN